MRVIMHGLLCFVFETSTFYLSALSVRCIVSMPTTLSSPPSASRVSNHDYSHTLPPLWRSAWKSTINDRSPEHGTICNDLLNIKTGKTGPMGNSGNIAAMVVKQVCCMCLHTVSCRQGCDLSTKRSLQCKRTGAQTADNLPILALASVSGLKLLIRRRAWLLVSLLAPNRLSALLLLREARVRQEARLLGPACAIHPNAAERVRHTLRVDFGATWDVIHLQIEGRARAAGCGCQARLGEVLLRVRPLREGHASIGRRPTLKEARACRASSAIHPHTAACAEANASDIGVAQASSHATRKARPASKEARTCRHASRTGPAISSAATYAEGSVCHVGLLVVCVRMAPCGHCHDVIHAYMGLVVLGEAS